MQKPILRTLIPIAGNLGHTLDRIVHANHLRHLDTMQHKQKKNIIFNNLGSRLKALENFTSN